jgi:hypothetical protein
MSREFLTASRELPDSCDVADGNYQNPNYVEMYASIPRCQALGGDLVWSRHPRPGAGRGARDRSIEAEDDVRSTNSPEARLMEGKPGKGGKI